MDKQNTNLDPLFLDGNLRDDMLKKIRDDEQYFKVKTYLESLYTELKPYLSNMPEKFPQKLKNQTQDGYCLSLFTELKIVKFFRDLVTCDSMLRLVPLSSNVGKNNVNADICIEKRDDQSKIWIEVTYLFTRHFTPMHHPEDVGYAAKEVLVRIVEQIASAIKKKYEQHADKISDSDAYIIAIDFSEYRNHKALNSYYFDPKELIRAIAWQFSNPERPLVIELYDRKSLNPSNPVLVILEPDKIQKLREDGYKGFHFDLYKDYPKLSGILLTCKTASEDIIYNDLPGNENYLFLLKNNIASKFPLPWSEMRPMT